MQCLGLRTLVKDRVQALVDPKSLHLTSQSQFESDIHHQHPENQKPHSSFRTFGQILNESLRHSYES